MSKLRCSKAEMDLNKVLKMNQEISESLLHDVNISDARGNADDNIGDSIELLNSLGKSVSVKKLSSRIDERNGDRKLEHRPVANEWDDILKEANEYISTPISLEDIMSQSEIEDSFEELDKINKEFSKKTSMFNKIDLSFLAIATGMQVAKSLIFPYVAKRFSYGEKVDKSERLKHNDKSIKDSKRKADDEFRNQKLKHHETGHWINILYQTPPYDITKGSKVLGINMGGAYHRASTLGHDPILGWIFGTANILTDIITLNNFKSYRVVRNPMRITNEIVPIGVMVKECYQYAQEDFLNIPAAIFAQAQHLKSDEYTKLGLPVPIISSINADFASKLYKSNYDALCFSRDSKVVGASFVISKIFDIIISLVHGLFRNDNESKDLFEVRTRKILLISNLIASTSTIINTSITSNPKNLDIGSVLNSLAHLFSDVRFIGRIKREFIESEISDRLQEEVAEIDRLYKEI